MNLIASLGYCLRIFKHLLKSCLVVINTAWHFAVGGNVTGSSNSQNQAQKKGRGGTIHGDISSRSNVVASNLASRRMLENCCLLGRQPCRLWLTLIGSQLLVN
jgi:hypothetical protein